MKRIKRPDPSDRPVPLRGEPDQQHFILSGNLEHVVYITGGRGSTAGAGLNIDGYWVMQRTFETGWRRASEIVPRIPVGHTFYTKGLWEPEVWEAFEKGERHNLGRSLKFFADHGMLPIRVLNPEAPWSKRFEKT